MFTYRITIAASEERVVMDRIPASMATQSLMEIVPALSATNFNSFSVVRDGEIEDTPTAHMRALAEATQRIADIHEKGQSIDFRHDL